jgi:pyochelin biosynthesis protein PchC
MSSLRLLSDPDEARMWLLCLPPGGGGAHLYRPWADRLPPVLGVAAIELPGHGSRAAEPAATDVAVLVEALARDVAPLSGRPVVVFGHSMGAVLAFDLVHRLTGTPGWRPVALVCAASESPDAPPESELADDVSPDALTARLSAWGGTAPELLDDTDYLTEMVPVLRGDLAMMARREHGTPAPLDLPVHVHLGAEDGTVDAERAETGWAAQTTAGHHVRTFPGGHFFVRESVDEVLAALLAVADAAVGGQLLPEVGMRRREPVTPAERGVAHG